MTDITIEIDGITAEVDEAEYSADPKLVESVVRAARDAASDLSGLHDEADWDYDGLAAVFGEDNESEVS